jgi:hypothetical protein
MVDAFMMTTMNKFYNCVPPRGPPPNADDSVFHETATAGGAPIVRFLSFALKRDKDFRIQPLQGGDQSIAWTNGIPATKEDIDL